MLLKLNEKLGIGSKKVVNAKVFPYFLNWKVSERVREFLYIVFFFPLICNVYVNAAIIPVACMFPLFANSTGTEYK